MSDTAPIGITQDQRDARDIINTFLDRIGLSSETMWAWDEITKGAQAPQIELDLQSRPAFQNRFQGIFLRQKTGLPPISVQDYLTYESQAAALLRASGLPPGFYDQPEDFANLIGTDVSINELDSRVTDGFAAVSKSPPEVRSAFQNFFGPSGDAALAAYFLDPQKALPVLNDQLSTAQAAGTGARYGFGLSQEQAQRVGSSQNYGRSSQFVQDQLEQGFQKLQKLTPVFQETVGEKNLTAEQQGTSAVFNLNNQDQSDVERRLANRAAAAKGSTSPLVTDRGFVGTGGRLT